MSLFAKIGVSDKTDEFDVLDEREILSKDESRTGSTTDTDDCLFVRLCGKNDHLSIDEDVSVFVLQWKWDGGIVVLFSTSASAADDWANKSIRTGFSFRFT